MPFTPASVRLALRQFIKAPGFAMTSILTLALGIGACTAMFSVINAVLLRPLPFSAPDALVWIENSGTGGMSARTTRVDTFNAWRDGNTSFDGLAAYFAFFDFSQLTLTGGGDAERLRAVGVSDNFVDVLGLRLALGRNFTPDECISTTPSAVLLTHAFWQRHFDGDPNAIGQSLTLNRNVTTIVGVLPESFDFDAIFSPGTDVDLITPFPLTAETAQWGNTVFGIGRLKPTVTPAQAEQDLQRISDDFKVTINYPGTLGARVTPINDALRGSFRPAFLVLTAAVICVLAIACVNLSNLLLGRTNARRQEFAVRTALGARRRHLIGQAMTESLLLAIGGAAVGIPLAIWATSALARLQTFGVPLLHNTSVDPAALLVTIGLTTLAGLACGVLPAWHLTRTASVEQATHQRTAGRGASLARNGLVVAEVALACTLLIGASLLLRSFTALLNVDLGFQPQHAAAWRVDPPRPFDSLGEANQYLDEVVSRVAALPGVESVGLSDVLPLGRNRTWGVRAQNGSNEPGTSVSVFPRIVSHEYLQTMQIPLVAGRYFDGRDTADSTRTVIINEHLASALWPDRDAVGQMLALNGGTLVIGVVGNVRHGSLEDSGGNEMYLDYHQSGWPGMEMVVRSSRPGSSLATEVRATLAAFDPTLPSGDFYELDALIDNAVAPRRLTTQLLGVFSLLALVLAALGLYGVIANSVVQRTQELGIRVAIGASRGSVLRLILGGGLKLVSIGIVIGVTGAFFLSRLIGSMLYGVTAHDPIAFVGNAVTIVLVAAVACIVPALRATRIDPITALRAD